jgi:hypothetical protein
MTMRYAHLAPDDLNDAIAALDRPAKGGGDDKPETPAQEAA